MNKIKLGGISVGIDEKPLVIAEMSGNHNQSLERALEIVEAAAETGVDGIKLQTYTPDTMTLNINNSNFTINDESSPWYGEKLYNLYKKAHTPWNWHKDIFIRAKELGLLYFSTPFDETAVDYLEKLNVPAYKIASFENVDLPLIRKVGLTGKPIIISTGMATIREINDAVSVLKSVNNNNVILLKCSSSYPADISNCNINTIPHMRNVFNCEIGFSDHTLGIGASLAAISQGACIIEKHFTLNRNHGGTDAGFSMEPNEMKQLVTEARNTWLSLGKIKYGINDQKNEKLYFRRSLYVTKNIKKGEKLKENHIKILRPNLGLKPKYKDIVLGLTVTTDLKAGTPLKFEYFK